MTQGIKTIIYPVKDIAQAKTLYSKLSGVEPYVDEPYYVGFRVADQEIGLDPHGHNHGMTAYWQVNHIRENEPVLRPKRRDAQPDSRPSIKSRRILSRL